MIVDTHTHVVSTDDARYPPGGFDLDPEVWHHAPPTPVEHLVAEMDSAGVDAALLVQAGGVYGADNSYASDARAVAPDRLATVAIVDMTRPDRVERLRYWAEARGVGGLRLFDIPPADPPWLDDPATAPVWDAIVELGLRVSVCVMADRVPALDRLLEWAPPVPVALDHCGLLDPGPTLYALAEHEQLRLKVTPVVLDRGPSDVVARLATEFGADRLMWGSNYAQTRDRPYRVLADQARAAAATLSAADQEAFLGSNAAALWPELRPEC